MPLANQPRTCYCGEVRPSHIGQKIVLKGWVHRRRDHGGVLFVDLRDREGLCQIVFDPQHISAERFEAAGALRDEYVIAVEGLVRRRPEGTENPNLATGEVELLVDEFVVLNTCRPLPFKLDEYTAVNEDVRLRYRFLDLRRPEMQRNFLMSHRLYQEVRNYFSENGFIEFTTPILTKSTPEGARDFLVPSRLNPGCFYALPQSPQLFKQLLMVAGYDRYFQIAPCFRDEDLRANRQPEFMQIDIEMSFVTPEDIFHYMEGMVCRVWKACLGLDVPRPFRRIPYEEAMLKYGSDKPDLRFDLPITELTDFFAGTDVKVFASALAARGRIRGLQVPGGANFSRKQLDDYTAFVATYGAKGLAWFKVLENELQSPLTKFLTPDQVEGLKQRMNAEVGDIIFIVAASEKVVCDSLGQLRLKIANDLGLIPEGTFSFAWITDFPLFEYSEREKVFTPSHHPFTAPVEEDICYLDEYNADPQKWQGVHPDDHPLRKVRALAYDLAVNGEELGGGSIRIHRRDVQNKVFRAIGIDDETAERKFGFLLDALSYGAPPHGGLAFGVARMLMLLLGEKSIREVIPFPKTQSGADLMVNAPSPVEEEQLRELCIRVVLPEPEKK